MAKQILYDVEARKKVLEGVRKLTRAVAAARCALEIRDLDAQRVHKGDEFTARGLGRRLPGIFHAVPPRSGERLAVVAACPGTPISFGEGARWIRVFPLVLSFMPRRALAYLLRHVPCGVSTPVSL